MKSLNIKQNTGLGARWRNLARRLCLSIRSGALARIVDGYLIRASVAGERGKAVILDMPQWLVLPLTLNLRTLASRADYRDHWQPLPADAEDVPPPAVPGVLRQLVRPYFHPDGVAVEPYGNVLRFAKALRHPRGISVSLLAESLHSMPEDSLTASSTRSRRFYSTSNPLVYSVLTHNWDTPRVNSAAGGFFLSSVYLDTLAPGWVAIPRMPSNYGNHWTDGYNGHGSSLRQLDHAPGGAYRLAGGLGTYNYGRYLWADSYPLPTPDAAEPQFLTVARMSRDRLYYPHMKEQTADGLEESTTYPDDPAVWTFNTSLADYGFGTLKAGYSPGNYPGILVAVHTVMADVDEGGERVIRKDLAEVIEPTNVGAQLLRPTLAPGQYDYPPSACATERGVHVLVASGRTSLEERGSDGAYIASRDFNAVQVVYAAYDEQGELQVSTREHEFGRFPASVPDLPAGPGGEENTHRYGRGELTRYLSNGVHIGDEESVFIDPPDGNSYMLVLRVKADGPLTYKVVGLPMVSYYLSSYPTAGWGLAPVRSPLCHLGDGVVAFVYTITPPPAWDETTRRRSPFDITLIAYDTQTETAKTWARITKATIEDVPGYINAGGSFSWTHNGSNVTTWQHPMGGFSAPQVVQEMKFKAGSRTEIELHGVLLWSCAKETGEGVTLISRNSGLTWERISDEFGGPDATLLGSELRPNRPGRAWV